MSVYSVRLLLSTKLGLEAWVNQVLLSMRKTEAITTAGWTAVYVLPSVAGFHLDDANQDPGYVEAHFTITFAHMLANGTPTAEATYIGTTVLPHQEVVMAKSFYEAIDGVYEVMGEIELTPPSRAENSNVVEWTVDVQLTVDPP